MVELRASDSTSFVSLNPLPRSEAMVCEKWSTKAPPSSRDAPDLGEEVGRLARFIRNCVMPRRPLHSRPVLFTIIMALLPSVYFSTLLFAAGFPVCLEAFSGAPLTSSTAQGWSSTAPGQAASLTNPLCIQVFQVLPWGGLITGYVSEPIRLISYSLFHINIAHLVGNLAVVGVCLWILETRYGTLHTGLVFFLSILGAALFAWWILPLGTTVIGISGAGYGLISMLGADVWLNWHTLRFPRYQAILGCTGILALVIEGIYNDPHVATIGHAGGLIAGMSVALLSLPRFEVDFPAAHRKVFFHVRWTAPLLLGGGLVIFQFAALPGWLMTHRLL